MAKLKRNIVILTLAIIIYLILAYAKSFLVTEKNVSVYVLNKNINRGDEILSTDLEKIVINSSTLNLNYVDNVENLTAKTDLLEGKILCKDDALKKEEYNALEDEKNERIILKLEDVDSKVQKNLAKSSIVNIYYTGRSSQVDSLVSLKNLKKLKSSSVADGYTTIALLNSVKVVDVYNKNGEVIKNNNTLSDNTPFAIAIEVDQDIAMLVQNLNNYGKFNITIKK